MKLHHVLWSVLLVACKGGEPVETDGGDTDVTDTAPPACADATATGTLALSFEMEADLIPSMDEPPVGTFYGSVFDAADVTALGPNDGAVALEDFSVASVDLTADGGPTAAMYTTGQLPACYVAVLGCLDSDGNDCDRHDPVTHPNDNRPLVVADAETAFTVEMNLLNPTD
jgi:hypothetical protein